jgi:hypothetical protein
MTPGTGHARSKAIHSIFQEDFMTAHVSCARLRALTPITLALLAGLPLSSQAQSTVDASLSNLRFELTDLAPQDGQTPALTWGNRYSDIAAFLRDTQASALPDPVPDDWKPAAPIWQEYHDNVEGWVNQTLSHDGIQVSTTEQGTMQFQLDLPLGVTGAGYVNLVGNFTLSPHTEARFYIDTQARATLQVPASTPFPNPAMPFDSNGNAEVLLYIYNWKNDGSPIPDAGQLQLWKSIGASDGLLQSYSDQGTRMAVFRNDSDVAKNFSVLMVGNASAYAVPEPSSLVLGLLGGAALIQRVRARRLNRRG